MTADGLLLVNKPVGVTSHDVVEVVRRKLGIRRVGHTGTLDPMAEGLLVLLIGPATKRQYALQRHAKLYEAAVELGVKTDTGDATGAVIQQAPVPVLDRRFVEDALASFLGTSAQRPPAYSAVKVQGRPAYWWARRHRPIELPDRTVHLSDVQLLELGARSVTFRVRCSAGTYIRTLGESIAKRLGTVGHLNRLQRIEVDHWHVGDAKTLAWIEQASPDLLAQQLRIVPDA